MFCQLRVKLIPLFKNANSLILFCKIVELNFIDENISFEGKNVMFVPLFEDFPIFLMVLMIYRFQTL